MCNFFPCALRCATAIKFSYRWFECRCASRPRRLITDRLKLSLGLKITTKYRGLQFTALPSFTRFFHSIFPLPSLSRFRVAGPRIDLCAWIIGALERSASSQSDTAAPLCSSLRHFLYFAAERCDLRSRPSSFLTELVNRAGNSQERGEGEGGGGRRGGNGQDLIHGSHFFPPPNFSSSRFLCRFANRQSTPDPPSK